MKFENDFIKAVANGDKLEEVKQLTPLEAFQLGLLVKKYEQEKK
ncbi:hypothetical protein AB4X15_15755 [Peribacillus simplex]